jgi:hypothetical protein
MRILTLLLTLALIISPSLPAFAALSDPKEAQSTELIAGTAGGAALGFGSAYLLGELCLSQTTGLDSIGCITFILIGYALGLPTGAIVGVNLAGAHSGVQGNLWLSILGGIGGGAIGILTAASLNNAVGEQVPGFVGAALFLGLAPFLASLGATWGYNSGAKLTPEVHSSASRSFNLLETRESRLLP